ncbi:MAG TPA: ketopantoate reductase C-terminal domain-containing protein, partial [Glaciihabitans sp.]|nr:ketopantoate reductase C-terminal domain-containing protein [Glaciihabitans sp.]
AYLVGTPIVVIQNGLDALTRAQRIAPGSDVVGGLATFASSYLSPGAITVTAPGHLYLGGGAGDHDVPARYAARVLGEVLPVTVLDNFVGAQWTKLIINHINALPAITGMSAQEVAANPTLLRIMTASMRETIGVASAQKIRFETLQGLSARKVRMLPHLPVSMGERLPRALISAMGAVPNPGSTLQSIRRGQPTEIDYLNGAVVRAAALNGGSAPINAALVSLVHEVERTGTFLSAEDVASRVPLTVR